jgi:hypothetical protein
MNRSDSNRPFPLDPRQRGATAIVAAPRRRDPYRDVVRNVNLWIDRLAAPAPHVSLRALIDPAWHHKRCDGDDLQVLDADTDDQDGFWIAPRLSSLSVHCGELALARIDDWRRGTTQLLALFQRAGRWRAASALTLASAPMRGTTRFSPGQAQQLVLESLRDYYEAVDAGHAAPLDACFVSCWHMKNREGRRIAVEDKATFLRRVDGIPLPGYAHAREIATVQVIGDRIAQVRVDTPSRRGVTVFNFARVGKRWMIVDKLWTMEPAPPPESVG